MSGAANAVVAASAQQRRWAPCGLRCPAPAGMCSVMTPRAAVTTRAIDRYPLRTSGSCAVTGRSPWATSPIQHPCIFRACASVVDRRAGVLVPDLTNVVLSRLQLYLTDKSHVHLDVRTRLRDTLISCCRISPRYSVPITRERHALLAATLPSRTSPGANCPRMRQSDNWRRSQRAARRVQCR